MHKTGYVLNCFPKSRQRHSRSPFGVRRSTGWGRPHLLQRTGGDRYSGYDSYYYTAIFEGDYGYTWATRTPSKCSFTATTRSFSSGTLLLL